MNYELKSERVKRSASNWKLFAAS